MGRKPKFTKEQRAEYRQNQENEAKERLAAGVASIQSSDDFKRFLDLAAKLHNYSFSNWMLILQQLPTASHCTGFKTWQSLGRSVRKGEKALRIFAPRIFKDRETGEATCGGFHVVSTFDISQTEGEAIGVKVPLLEGIGDAALYERFATFARSKYELIDNEPQEVCGYWKPSKKIIAVNSEISGLQRLKTLAHEIAHALAGHGTKENESKTNEAEVSAESAAYIVCSYFGIDTSERSFPYIAQWAGDFKTFKSMMTEASRVSKMIIEGVEKCK